MTHDAVEDNQWSDATAIFYFKHFLTKDAATWFKLSVRPAIRDDWTWQDLFTKFEENYLGRAEENRIRAILRGLIMTREDRANNFIPKVRQYLLLLCPDMPEKEQVDRIAEKLRGEFAPMISDKEPQTIDELTQCCRKVEAAKDIQRAIVQTTNQQERQLNSHKSKPAARRYTNITNSQQGVTIKTCHRCGRRTHLKSFCIPKTRIAGSRLIHTHLSKKNKNATRPKAVSVVIDAGEDEEEEDEVNVESLVAVIDSGSALLRQELICNKVPVNALVDTGSKHTIISEKLAAENQWSISSGSKSLIGANGKSLHVCGYIRMDIELTLGYTKKTKKHKVILPRGLHGSMLMGTD